MYNVSSCPEPKPVSFSLHSAPFLPPPRSVSSPPSPQLPRSRCEWSALFLRPALLPDGPSIPPSPASLQGGQVCSVARQRGCAVLCRCPSCCSSFREASAHAPLAGGQPPQPGGVLEVSEARGQLPGSSLAGGAGEGERGDAATGSPGRDSTLMEGCNLRPFWNDTPPRLLSPLSRE